MYFHPKVYSYLHQLNFRNTDVGDAQFGAKHPIVNDFDPQISSSVVNLVTISPSEVNLIQGETTSIEVNLTNPSSIQLTSLTATISSLPSGISFTSQFPSSEILPG